MINVEFVAQRALYTEDQRVIKCSASTLFIKKQQKQQQDKDREKNESGINLPP